MVAWCYSLTHQFLLNYADLSVEFVQLLSETSELPYTKFDLLSNMGIDLHCPTLLKSVLQYSMKRQSIQDFKCSLVDLETNVPVVLTGHNERPILEDVLHNHWMIEERFPSWGRGGLSRCVLLDFTKSQQQ